MYVENKGKGQSEREMERCSDGRSEYKRRKSGKNVSFVRSGKSRQKTEGNE